MGISTGTTLLVRRSLTCWYNAVEVGVFLVHHRDHEEHRVARETAWWNVFSVPTSTPPWALTTLITPSAAAIPAMASRGSPGTRRVDQVDLGVHPLGECAAQADGVAPLGLLGGMVR